MFAFTTLVALASAALPNVLVHGGVLSYQIEGQMHQGWQAVSQMTIQRPWSSYNPITDPIDPTFACNDDGTSGALQLTADATARDAITAYENQVWPHAYGPMCPGSTCTGVNAQTLSWFKIDEAGLLNGMISDEYWGAGKMIDQNSLWTTTIPSTVPSGNYLIRFETIVLHSLPAQIYPECAQINISSSGSRQPTTDELVTFAGAYSSTDHGSAWFLLLVGLWW